MNKIKTRMRTLIFLCTLISFIITGCQSNTAKQEQTEIINEISVNSTLTEDISLEETTSSVIESFSLEDTTEYSKLSQVNFDFSNIPKYQDNPYVTVNNNVPFFDSSDLTATSFAEYKILDDLGRCGVTYACIGKDIMPAQERGSIGNIKPSGWHTVKYDNIDGKYLYNRCHLIGYQLTGENDNPYNLITGTRALNIDGMLPFENMTADYVKETNNHVLYRVTPIFENDNLLADGVLMEGYSVEDNGAGICFCVYAYNAQPGIDIDYSDGNSKLSDIVKTYVSGETQNSEQTSHPVSAENKKNLTYILNTNTDKFHYPACSSVKQMAEKNKREYSGTRDEVINQGFSPCKRCNP